MNLKCLQQDKSIPAFDRKRNRQVPTVASQSLQYRVATPIIHSQTPYCKLAQPKMADAIFGFGRTHAPQKSSGFDQKNTIVGKYREKAATSLNMGLAQAGHCLVGKYL